MADIAVGLVSLALQVSQGLDKYVKAVRDGKDMTAYFLQDVARLSEILERLESVVKRMEQG